MEHCHQSWCALFCPNDPNPPTLTRKHAYAHSQHPHNLELLREISCLHDCQIFAILFYFCFIYELLQFLLFHISVLSDLYIKLVITMIAMWTCLSNLCFFFPPSVHSHWERDRTLPWAGDKSRQPAGEKIPLVFGAPACTGFVLFVFSKLVPALRACQQIKMWNRELPLSSTTSDFRSPLFFVLLKQTSISLHRHDVQGSFSCTATGTLSGMCCQPCLH